MTKDQRFLRAEVFTFAAGFFFCTAFIAIGLITVSFEESRALRESFQRLTSLGRLKVLDISRWRSERLADANFISSSTQIASDLQRLSSDGSDRAAREGTKQWMRSMYSNGRYVSMSAYTTGGRLLHAEPTRSAAPMIDHHFIDTLRLVRGHRFSPLHAHGDSSIHLSVDIPIITQNSPGSRILVGIVLLEIDPANELYPMLQSWPVPDSTAEVLLFRRDGDEVVFLNNVRGRTDMALRLRFSATTQDLPAARGARGIIGPMEGVDFKGNPVIAYVDSIPGSDWMIVAKVDRDELLSDLGRIRSIVSVAVGIGVLLVLISAALIRHEVRRRIYREQMLNRTERMAVRDHYENLSRFANDCIILTDAEDVIVEVNERAVEMYGYSQHELIGNPMSVLWPEEGRVENLRHREDIFARNSLLFETVHRTKDGNLLVVEVSARRIDSGHRTYIQRIVRNITARKRAEEALAIERERMRSIMQATGAGSWECNIQTGDATFDEKWTAMIGYRPDELAPMSFSTWERLTHPTDLIRAKALVQAHFDGRNPLYEAEFRMRHKDGHWVWIIARGRLLSRTTDGSPLMMFGTHLDISDRKLAEELFHKQEHLLREMGAFAHIGAWEFDPITGRGAWTEEVARIHGVDPAVQPNVEDELRFYRGDSLKKIRAALEEIRSSGTPYDLELELETAQGERKWVRTIGTAETEDGKVVRVRGSFQDVTESRRLQTLRDEQFEELRRWHSVSLERESRVLELKREVNDLLRLGGQPERYGSVTELK